MDRLTDVPVSQCTLCFYAFSLPRTRPTSPSPRPVSRHISNVLFLRSYLRFDWRETVWYSVVFRDIQRCSCSTVRTEEFNKKWKITTELSHLPCRQLYTFSPSLPPWTNVGGGRSWPGLPCRSYKDNCFACEIQPSSRCDDGSQLCVVCIVYLQSCWPGHWGGGQVRRGVLTPGEDRRVQELDRSQHSTHWLTDWLWPGDLTTRDHSFSVCQQLLHLATLISYLVII